jgi:hypothetical protein
VGKKTSTVTTEFSSEIAGDRCYNGEVFKALNDQKKFLNLDFTFQKNCSPEVTQNKDLLI